MSKIRLHGSSSGYTEIAPVAASGNNTLTLPNDGTIISKDSAGAIGITSVRATNAHFSGTTRVTTGITTTATITTGTITTAKVTTIQDASGNNSSTPEQIEQGRAKVWVNFKTEGGYAIRDSFNVSSLADAGNYIATINYTTDFANANYAVVCSCIQNDAAATGTSARTPRVANPVRTDLVVGSVSVTSSDFSSNNDEELYLFVVCFGDQ